MCGLGHHDVSFDVELTRRESLSCIKARAGSGVRHLMSGSLVRVRLLYNLQTYPYWRIRAKSDKRCLSWIDFIQHFFPMFISFI